MNRGSLSGVTPRQFDEREFLQQDARYADSTYPPYVSIATLAKPRTWDPATQTYNCTPDKYTAFRLALAKSKAGVSKCYIYFDGDSLTSGSQLGIAPETYSYTAIARTLMSNSARWGTVVEPGPITLDNIGVQTDYRLSTTGTLSTSGGLNQLGVTSSAHWGGNAGGWTITFGPVICDTFEVYDTPIGFPAGAGWTWSIDGGAGTFQSESGTSGTAQNNRKITISAGSVGSHTLTITGPAAGNYGVITGIAYKTAAATSGVVWAKRGVGGARAGTPGSTANDWMSNRSVDLAYTGGGTNSHPTPHLVVLQLGTNAEVGNSPASFYANMAALISTIKGVGSDVLLCVAPPGGGGVSSAQATYLRAVAPICYQLADKFDIGLFDMFWRWGPTYLSTQDQYYQVNGNSGHPNPAGHNDMGFGIYNALLRIA